MDIVINVSVTLIYQYNKWKYAEISGNVLVKNFKVLRLERVES